ncbi:MAG: CAP domain-containing protein [Oscillospiraceae bacterium]|nr:CAP domain-containing protein [Oscillospiraceae bacterium]
MLKKAFTIAFSAIMAVALLAIPANAATFSTTDALNILRYVAGTGQLSAQELTNYDLNGDGAVTSADALLVLRAVADSSGAVPVTTPQDIPDSTTAITAAEEVLKYVNEARAGEGLAALKLDETMCLAAQLRAEEISRVYSHDRPDGSSVFTVFKEFGITYRTAAENIAYGDGMFQEARSVVDSWLASPGHRANILNPDMTTLGVGVYAIGREIYWVQLFTG